jgi:hypothetical protein
MGRRFAIVIGVAAAGVMALGAQTASSTTGDPVDSTPPDLQLSGKKKQKIGIADPGDGWEGSFPNGHCESRECRRAVKVDASCGDEACTVRAEGKLTKGQKGKLKPARDDLDPANDGNGERTTLYLKLPPSTHKKAYKALDAGEKVLAKVTVEAKDAAGNVATATRTIKLVK